MTALEDEVGTVEFMTPTRTQMTSRIPAAPATRATATNRFQKALHQSPILDAIRIALDLDPARRYDMAIIRVSVRSAERLDRQEETGLQVFGHLPDFAAFGMRTKIDQDQSFVTIRYRDLDSRAGTGAVGWVGLVGNTLFLAVHDSAAIGTLPAVSDDPAQLARNAFTEAAIVVGLAGSILNLYVPFRTRWWRDTSFALRLLHALRSNLTHLRMWEESGEVDITPAGEIIENFKGGTAAQQVSQNKISAFEKNMQSMEAGRWPRADHELPTGLQRCPRPGHSKPSTEVELVADEVTAIRTLLKSLATGQSWAEIGRQAAAVELQMRGPVGIGRTYADIRPAELGSRARALFSAKALNYYEHGSFTQRCTTSLPMDRIVGHELSFDPITRKRFKDVVCDKFPFPESGFADPDEWQRIRVRFAEEAEFRSRRGGGANHERTVGSAFTGVAAQLATSGEETVEHLFSPETSTAYRLRVRPPEHRGARNREGQAVATFRKVVFDRAAGYALLTTLESIADPIAPFVVEDPSDPLAAMRLAIAELESDRHKADAAASNWDEAFETENDPAERTFLRTKAKEARDSSRSITNKIDAALDALRTAENDLEPVETNGDADLTLPVLVADGLLNSDGMPPVQIRDGLRRIGLLDTLHCTPSTTDQPIEWWTFTAVADIEMLDGTIRQLPVQWTVPASGKATGALAGSSPAFIAAWADGLDLVSAAAVAGLKTDLAAYHLRAKIRRSGVPRRGLRTAARHVAVAQTRQVIAARLLNDPSMAKDVSEPWAAHIEDVYWNNETPKRGTYWCPRDLTVARQILSDIVSNGSAGVDADALGRRRGLSTETTYRIIGRYHLADRDGRRVRPRACIQDRCNGVLGHLLPTPETAPHGLICTSCLHTESGVLVPADYLQFHTFVDGTATIEPAPSPFGRLDENDRRLTTTAAAAVIGVHPWAIRELANNNELECVRGPGVRGGPRLFKETDIKRLNVERGPELRARCLTVTRNDALTTGQAAAYLGIDAHRVRALVKTSALAHTLDAAGQRRFRIADLDAVNPQVIESLGSGLVSIGTFSQASGLTTRALVGLSDDRQIPHVITPGKRRRFDLSKALAALDSLGLAEGDEILSIGQAAQILGVTTTILRARSDDGTIPTAYRIGGKRRFRRTDIEHAVATNVKVVRRAGRPRPGT